MRLLGEAASPSVTVRIGAENRSAGRVRRRPPGYGAGDQALAKLGVLGPTRMDYPTNDGSGARRGTVRWPDPGGVIVANDYYAMLGVRRDACRTRSRRPTGGWPASCTRTSTPIRRRRSGSRRSPRPTRCCPTRRSARCTTWAPTRSRGRAGGAAGSAGSARPGSRSATSWTPSSAPGAGATRGPRSRARRGRNATIRVELDLSECAFGATRELTVDTAVVCPTCSGEGTAPGTHPETCDVCGGRGEVSQVTRSFLGQVMTSRPCPALRRVRHRHPPALPGVRRRRPGPHPAHDQGPDPGRRRGRHAHPAGRRGRDRPRRRPARRPVPRDRAAAAPDLRAAGRRPALHGDDPDGGGRPGRHALGGDPGRPAATWTSAPAPSPARSSRCTGWGSST